MPTNEQPQDTLEALRAFDTCLLANAIEQFQPRPWNEGFMTHAAICRFPHSRPVIGHAVTGRIRTYMPPVSGRCYYDHIDWWRYVESVPPPTVIVLQDFDNRPGFGALLGEVHARICVALKCVAFVTNGAVRDIQDIETLGLQLFSGHVSVSHAYAHIVDFGQPVEVGGLEVKPGDILHGDRHGILSVPSHLVDKLPGAAQELQRKEQHLFAVLGNPDFTAEAFGGLLSESSRRGQ